MCYGVRLDLQGGKQLIGKESLDTLKRIMILSIIYLSLPSLQSLMMVWASWLTSPSSRNGLSHPS